MNKCNLCKCEKRLYRSGLCVSCWKHLQDQLKIEKWLKTGDTSCGTKTTLRNGIRDYIYNRQDNKCAICGLSRYWNNKDLKFILDHIDGDCTNNHSSNVRLICPNCDSQLPTFKSKNRKSQRIWRTNYKYDE